MHQLLLQLVDASLTDIDVLEAFDPALDPALDLVQIKAHVLNYPLTCNSLVHC